jgi:hypothetical protein
MVFPATLLVLDDFDPDNKILGCTMMDHVIKNVVIDCVTKIVLLQYLKFKILDSILPLHRRHVMN